MRLVGNLIRNQLRCTVTWMCSLAGWLTVISFSVWNLTAVTGGHKAATQHLLVSRISLYKCYLMVFLPLLILNIQNVCQFCSATFSKSQFALILLQLLYLRLYLSDHLGPSQATKWKTSDYIWVEKYFKKSFWRAKNFQKQNGIRQSRPLLYYKQTVRDMRFVTTVKVKIRVFW